MRIVRLQHMKNKTNHESYAGLLAIQVDDKFFIFHGDYAGDYLTKDEVAQYAMLDTYQVETALMELYKYI